MRVCDLHVCMCFCGHFDEEKILPTFFKKKNYTTTSYIKH